MRTVLNVIGGVLEGQRFDVDGEEISVGRDQSCAIHLPGEDVSRQHARLIRDENYYFLEDMASENGTTVNGTKIRRHCLRSGDVIEIGSHVLSYSAEGTGTERSMDQPLRQEAAALANGDADEDGAPVRKSFNIPAFASLGLALLGLPWLLGQWFGVGAVVLGVVGLVQILRSGRERGLVLAIVGMGVGAAAAGWGIWTTMVQPQREVMQRDAAVQETEKDMKRLFKAMRQYSLEHQDKLPDKLTDLHPKYVDSKDPFVCPLPGGSGDNYYVLHLAGKPFINKHERILLYTPEPFEGGRFVLFGDGKVGKLDIEEFSALTGGPRTDRGTSTQ